MSCGKYDLQHTFLDLQGSVLQFIAINVRPRLSYNGNLASVLRNAAVEDAVSNPSIQQIVAMTRCSEYSPDKGDYESYVKSSSYFSLTLVG